MQNCKAMPPQPMPLPVIDEIALPIEVAQRGPVVHLCGAHGRGRKWRDSCGEDRMQAHAALPRALAANLTPQNGQWVLMLHPHRTQWPEARRCGHLTQPASAE